MPHAYIVGHIRVKDPQQWAEYRSRVPATFEAWNAELVFRGRQGPALAGASVYPEVVVTRFPDMAAIEGWFNSPAYQALVPIREQAADVVLLTYEA
jgi:uncharacterized protein (DUF1330 family)